MAELVEEKYEPMASENKQRTRICFVCTGNTCRSPMAEAVANMLLRNKKNQALKAIGQEARDAIPTDTEAFSRGLYAISGDPISRGALEALEAAEVLPIQGHDYRLHTAKTLTKEDVASFDLLVGMTPTHTMELLMRFPEAAGRITCMPESIADPFGADAEIYRMCLSQITRCVARLLGMEENA